MHHKIAVFCALLAIVCVARAQPCIECKDCGSSDFCLTQCKRTCPTPKPATVDLDRCKKAGEKAGRDTAKDACDKALLFCRGGVKTTAQAVRGAQVSLKQCGNAAFGICQTTANSPSSSPCGYAFNGYQQCSKDQFTNFYSNLVNEGCNSAADKIEKQGPGAFGAR